MKSQQITHTIINDFTIRECSRLLSFLDHFDKNTQRLNLKSINIFFLNFFMKAHESLIACFTRVNYRIEINQQEECIVLHRCIDDEQQISLEEFIELLELRLQVDDAYDYDQLNVQMIQSAMKVLLVLQEQTGHVLDGKKLDVIHWQKLYIDHEDENLEFTAEHQWNYSASSIGLILYPDPRMFLDLHWSYWRQVRGDDSDNRLYRDYEFRCCVVFHEIIHCFQGHKWPFKNFKLWNSEFEASYTHFDLLYTAANIVDKENEIWSHGFAEEIILWMFNSVYNIHCRLQSSDKPEDKAIIEGYERWRDSHGRVDPCDQNSDEIFDTNKSYNTYLKHRLPLEAFSEGNRLVPFLKFHWNANLTLLDTYNDEQEVPEDLIIKSDHSLDTLAKPVEFPYHLFC
jgi:hypothetical protein